MSKKHDVSPISITKTHNNNHHTSVITNTTKNIESSYDTIHRDYFIDPVTERMNKKDKKYPVR